MKMSWEYIAGFFDGEGHVSTARSMYRTDSATTIAGIAQTGSEGMQVLTAIQRFLLERDIKAYITSDKRPSKYRQMHRLHVCARAHVTSFLQEMLPRVSVKKVIVQDTLRYFKLYPLVRAPGSSRGKAGKLDLTIEQIKSDLAVLGTQKAVAAKYGVSQYTIMERLDPQLRARRNAYRNGWQRRRKAAMIAARLAEDAAN